MTKSSKVETPTTWPFILYCMCCCCLPILVCCIFIIMIASANEIEGSKKNDNYE